MKRFLNDVFKRFHGWITTGAVPPKRVSVPAKTQELKAKAGQEDAYAQSAKTYSDVAKSSDLLEKDLTPEQLANAQKQANELQSQIEPKLKDNTIIDNRIKSPIIAKLEDELNYDRALLKETQQELDECKVHLSELADIRQSLQSTNYLWLAAASVILVPTGFIGIFIMLLVFWVKKSRFKVSSTKTAGFWLGLPSRRGPFYSFLDEVFGGRVGVLSPLAGIQMGYLFGFSKMLQTEFPMNMIGLYSWRMTGALVMIPLVVYWSGRVLNVENFELGLASYLRGLFLGVISSFAMAWLVIPHYHLAFNQFLFYPLLVLWVIQILAAIIFPMLIKKELLKKELLEIRNRTDLSEPDLPESRFARIQYLSEAQKAEALEQNIVFWGNDIQKIEFELNNEIGRWNSLSRSERIKEAIELEELETVKAQRRGVEVQNELEQQKASEEIRVMEAQQRAHAAEERVAHQQANAAAKQAEAAMRIQNQKAQTPEKVCRYCGQPWSRINASTSCHKSPHGRHELV